MKREIPMREYKKSRRRGKKQIKTFTGEAEF